jgi:predicted TIM-barrel fold metal-dependent hydrolase
VGLTATGAWPVVVAESQVTERTHVPRFALHPKTDLDLFSDNFMFSTGYPHGTSLGPAPCGGTELTPVEFAHEAYVSLDPEFRTKALSRNAKAVYELDLKQA